MPTPSQIFAAAMDRADLTTIELGKRLGCDPSTISHLRSGRRTPGLRLAAAIEDVSRGWPGGAITATSWARPVPQRRKRAA